MSDTVIKIENISKQYRLGNVGLGTIGADPTTGVTMCMAKKILI
ncbi:MAG TPA: hypothetical protein VIJ95_13545 [Hanamia sp.]